MAYVRFFFWFDVFRCFPQKKQSLDLTFLSRLGVTLLT